MRLPVVCLFVCTIPLIVLAETQEDQQTIKKTVLVGVLKEYLDDIETVELAVAKCAVGHRGRHQGAEAALGAAQDRCVTRGQRGDGLVTCMDQQTQRVVSDVRQHITALKNCVDSL